MFELLNETLFEKHIAEYLAGSKMYNQRTPKDALNIVIETINTKINRGESLLSLLKNGFMLQGRRIRLAAFKPKMTLDDDDADHLYKKNIFSVVRQMKYSTQGFDKDNELDTCLVHFAMDNNRVMMTTQLAGDNTRFLPFNKETVNPQVEGDYPTCYMWKEVLQADSLLNLIQHFIKHITPKKGEPFYIFPRYHQLRCVRNIISTQQVQAKQRACHGWPSNWQTFRI